MALQRLLLLFCLTCLFSACARPFVKPDLTTAPYSPVGTSESVLDFDFTQQPLELPAHFASKLDKANIQLHSLRIRNLTSDTVWLRIQDVQLYYTGRPLKLVPPKQVYKALRQPVAIHALWFLVGPIVRTDGEEKTLDYHPLGVGFAAWGIRNGIVAYKANQEAKELAWHSLPAGDTFVAPGHAVYLLIPLRGSGPRTAPIELRYKAAGNGAAEATTEQE